MTARVIDGKTIAATLRAQLQKDVAARTVKGLRAPGLAVVLAGDDPASSVLHPASSRLASLIPETRYRSK